MTTRPSIIERAFELAREGQCRSLDDIRRALAGERYEAIAQHVSGPSLARQLRAIIAASS